MRALDQVDALKTEPPMLGSIVDADFEEARWTTLPEAMLSIEEVTDDLEQIAVLHDQLVDDFQLDYHPRVHADAVLGWAWSVFSDYDLDENPLAF